MPILSDYLRNMNRIKEDIKQSSELLLKKIPEKFLDWPDNERRTFLTNMLYDFWELHNPDLEKAIKLGRKKAKALINA